MSHLFKNLRIGVRMALGFGAMVALILVMHAFNSFQIAKVKDRLAELTTVQAERLALAEEWRQNIAVNAQRAFALSVSTDPTLATGFESLVKKTTARTTEVVKRFAEIETSPEGLKRQEKLLEARKTYVQFRETMMNARDGGNAANLHKLSGNFMSQADAYVAIASELVDYEDRRGQALGQEATAALDFAQSAAQIISLVCGAMAVLTGWRMTRSIVRPLAAAQRTAEKIASGDLSGELRSEGHDEVGQMTAALDQMQQALRELVGGIRVTAERIGGASAEVAMGNNDLSTRTEQSAASLQCTASSVEAMTGAARTTAESVRQADHLANQASSVAAQGGAAVVNVVRAMEGIQDSSRKISDIIGTIDGIAFQTNILALNAAVEAARAGEQGRGFSVVASEVRSLAQRSSTAAKEIRMLIGDSLTRVESGSLEVQQAGQTLTEVVTRVKGVSDIVAQIASAAAQQAHGVDEINQAIASLDQATQQNAALVEQSAAAASSLQSQAHALSLSMQRFRLTA